MKIDSRWQPGTRTGWWAVGLAAAFVILMAVNSLVFMRLPEQVGWRMTILPAYGIFMILCGLLAGSLGLIAVAWKRERSWLVWLTMLPGLFVLFLLIGEFAVPH